MNFFEVQTWKSDSPKSMHQLHGHEYFELYFLLDGQKRYISQTSIYNVAKSCLVITKPHYLHMFEGGPFKRVLITITPNMLAPHQVEFLTKASETPIYTFSQNVMSKITKLLSTMLKENKELSHESEINSHMTLDYLLYLISKYKIPYEAKENLKTNIIMHPIVLKVTEYISQHYNERILVTELCNKFHISKTWLCKKFLESMHCSITNYQIILRVNKAKELLSLTTRSIESISNELGFSSPKYFGLAFKKVMDISPMQYRKRI